MTILQFIASTAIDNMFDSGNYFGGVIAIFTESMGGAMFFGLIFLGVSGVLYIRYQSVIPVVLLGILLFGTISIVIPTQVIGFVVILFSLAGAVILYQVMTRGTR